MKTRYYFVLSCVVVSMGLSILWGGKSVAALLCNTKCIVDTACPDGTILANPDGTPLGCTSYFSLFCTGSCTKCSGSGNGGYCKYTGVSTDTCNSHPQDTTNCGTISIGSCSYNKAKKMCECVAPYTVTTNPCELPQCGS